MTRRGETRWNANYHRKADASDAGAVDKHRAENYEGESDMNYHDYKPTLHTINIESDHPTKGTISYWLPRTPLDPPGKRDWVYHHYTFDLKEGFDNGLIKIPPMKRKALRAKMRRS